jgi:hypothetical protein
MLRGDHCLYEVYCHEQFAHTLATYDSAQIVTSISVYMLRYTSSVNLGARLMSWLLMLTARGDARAQGDPCRTTPAC